MENYKFYTPPLLAEYLLSMIPKRSYKNVIDICCGSWNLLRAAKNYFGDACYTGVDVDENAKTSRLPNATFICGDGRKFALEEKNKYDLVLSNPPFGRLREEERIFKGKKTGTIARLNTMRYENEMLQANLLLAAENAILLFILPSTFFEGESYLSIRKELCQKYTVDMIIKLPEETFGNSRINTYALIMRNSGEQKARTRLKTISFNGGIWKAEFVRWISPEQMKAGTWTKPAKLPAKADDVEVFRGNISSGYMTRDGERVLHSSSCVENGEWKPSVRYCNDEKRLQDSKKAHPGNILVNRVGKYAAYWCICREEAIISDCIIAISAEKMIKLYDSMLKQSVNGRLDIPTRGVTTKYITVQDIMEVFYGK